MAEHSTDISVSACYSELPRLLGRLAENADRLGIPADDGLRLQLLAEELFTNTLRHGFNGDSETSVCLGLGRKGDTLYLYYEDNAPPFDPTKVSEKWASEKEVGGLGLGLIRGMSRDFRYERRNNCNCIEIEL